MNTSVTASVDTSYRGERQRFYRPELDLLRLFAFMLVFVHHAMPAAYIRSYSFFQILSDACESGLQLFFLLSAFLIAELLLREKEATGKIHLKAFYVRRILRIWPLYFLMIFAGAALGRWTHFTPRDLLAFVLLSGNWIIYTQGFLLSPLGPLWSISIEEQFYLIWPMLAKFGQCRVLYLSSILFLLLANITLYLLGNAAVPSYKVWSHTLVEFQFFAVGILLALQLHGKPKLSLPPVLRLLLLLAAIGLALTATRYLAEPTGLRLILSFAALTLSVLAMFLTFYGLRVPALCAPLLYLGRISYGLYVFHFFGIAGAAHLLPHLHIHAPLVYPATALLLTVGIAALSYRFVETPFLRLKQRFTFVSSRQEPSTTASGIPSHGRSFLK